MRAELDALVDVLEAAGLTVYDPDDEPTPDLAPPAPPYVEVTPARNADEQSRLTGPASDEVLQISVRSVGESRAQAMWLDERVDSVLRPGRWGIALAVPGRVCSPLERRASDLYPDDTLGRVWESVTSYRFVSSPY